MMKMFYITIKDLWRAFRSYYALAFMFGVPILMTLLFAFLLGGTLSEEDNEFSLPVTEVILVNQDAGNPYIDDLEDTGETFSSMGDILFDVLNDDSFANIMNVTLGNETEARAAVDAQTAGLAIIIPPDFSDAIFGQALDEVTIEFYKDPDLSLGPQIVQSIVMGIVDGFSSGTLSIDSILKTLESEGISLTMEERLALIETLTQDFNASREAWAPDLRIVSPADVANEGNQGSFLITLLRSIMGGMMIFYAFYTGTSAAQTILAEEEQGTLARLFISPTDTHTILKGKFLTGILMVIVQVIILMVFSNLVFGVVWGPILHITVFLIGLVMLANSFGIFIMSLVKSTKQAGVLYGAVLTITGMFGISSVFTGGTPIEKAFEYLPLIVPQGWAMKTLEYVWSGDLGKTLLFGGGMVAWAVVLFGIGNARIKKRYV